MRSDELEAGDGLQKRLDLLRSCDGWRVNVTWIEPRVTDYEQPCITQMLEEREQPRIREVDTLVVRMKLDSGNAIRPKQFNVLSELWIARMDRSQLKITLGNGFPLESFAHRHRPAEDGVKVLWVGADRTVDANIDATTVHVLQLRRDRGVAHGTQRTIPTRLDARHQLLAHHGDGTCSQLLREVVRMEINYHGTNYALAKISFKEVKFGRCPRIR